MRSLMWMNAVVGTLLIFLSVVSYRYGERQFLAESPPTVTQKINEIQDIEHLRKLALLLVRGNDETVRNTNKTLTVGINAFAALELGFAIFAMVNWLSILKHRRIAEGRPIKWLAWL